MSDETSISLTVGDSATAVGGVVHGDDSPRVTGVRHDSRSVQPGDAFCCIVGAVHDGHDHAGEAIARGASCVVVERLLPSIDPAVPQIVVRDTRVSIGALSAAVYKSPSRRLRVVGVTGTNGKTTTVAVLASIFTAAGFRTETLGTLSGVRTTPEADDLQRSLSSMVDDGVEVVAMEVSSHALDLHRTDGTIFERAVFTNLSRDHLDHHGDMVSYFSAKARLFESGRALSAVINTDDEWGRRLAAAVDVPVVGYSPGDATDVDVRADGVSFTWRGRRIAVPIGGRFTVANAVAAMVTAESMGVDTDAIVRGCGAVPPVTGRFQSVANVHGIDVIVDYAHTAEGLAALVATAREITSGRVILVFGCGGERDSGKRAPMGAAAASADVVVVTSDNPRGEDPLAIIADVVSGVRGGGVEPEVQPDRALAIGSAISVARRGDIVVIAGKGHERTQEIAGEFHPFVDADVAAAALESRKGDNA